MQDVEIWLWFIPIGQFEASDGVLCRQQALNILLQIDGNKVCGGWLEQAGRAGTPIEDAAEMGPGKDNKPRKQPFSPTL